MRRLENEQCVLFANFLIENHIPFMRIELNIPTKKDGFGKIKQLQKEGWKSGYSDYFITVPITDKDKNITHCGLFLEMKKIGGAFPLKTGKDTQYEFLMEKAHLQYASFCCLGAESAIQVTQNYLKGIITSLHEPRQRDSRLKCVARCYNELLI